jgi:hypothetical protein
VRSYGTPRRSTADSRTPHGASGSVTFCVYELQPWVHVKWSSHSITSSMLPGMRMVWIGTAPSSQSHFSPCSELLYGRGLPGSCSGSSHDTCAVSARRAAASSP